MKVTKTLTALLLGTSLLSACSDDVKDPSLTDGSKNAANGINDASTNGLNKAGNMNVQGLSGDINAGRNGLYGNNTSNGDDELNDPNSPQTKVIYFMLDSSEVQPDFVPVVAAHAQYLVANPSLHIILEGNTDERGSREYNIALGEQRARSVANMMRAQGVSDSQLQVVSYGEEKPAATGSDESSWEQNRRVELVYTR